MNKKILSLVPARAGSKRIPEKNIIDLGGKPLIYHMIKALQDSKSVTEIIVSSDSDKILQIAAKFGVDTSKRPAALAADNTTTFETIHYELSKIELKDIDYIMINQPTSPFLKPESIKKAINKITTNGYDCLISVSEIKLPKYFWKFENDKLEKISCNCVSEKIYKPNGAIYIYKKDFYIKCKDAYPFSENNTGYIVLDEIESIDIDTPADLQIARALKNLK